ncbi:hypothetical protein ACWD6P_08190, partial [Streptomyces sp. NPDC002446]
MGGKDSSAVVDAAGPSPSWLITVAADEGQGAPPRTFLHPPTGGGGPEGQGIDFTHQVALALRSDPLLQAGTRIAVETTFS